MPRVSTRNPVPSATSAVVSGAPGNIAAGPDLTGAPARIATTPWRAPAIRSTNEPGALGYRIRGRAGGAGAMAAGGAAAGAADPGCGAPGAGVSSARSRQPARPAHA